MVRSMHNTFWLEVESWARQTLPMKAAVSCVWLLFTLHILLRVSAMQIDGSQKDDPRHIQSELALELIL